MCVMLCVGVLLCVSEARFLGVVFVRRGKGLVLVGKSEILW